MKHGCAYWRTDWIYCALLLTKTQGKVILKEITRAGLMNDFWNVWRNLSTSEVNYCLHQWLGFWNKDGMHVKCLMADCVIWMVRIKRQLENLKCINQLLTYLLTPWSRVLLKKLIGFQLVKKFPTFYGARRFITAVTSARHLSLSWASLMQSIPLHPTCLKIHLNIILSSMPGSPKWFLTLRFPHQNPVYASPFPHSRYMPRPSHSFRISHPNSIWWAV
jgi:hypothetical protein